MSDRFTGHWLVSEYVYNPDGSFAGIIHQRRHLETQADDTIRVIQRMQTPPELAAHPMGRFAGEWAFDLVRQGVTRQYHGPDVVGSGTPYGAAAMLGQGIWPRFGHNFTSFALMPHEGRQITGGKFYNAGQMIANIIGIAYPETADAPDDWPTFTGPEYAEAVSEAWTGDVALFAAAGKHKLDTTLLRTYAAGQFIDAYTNEQTIYVMAEQSGEPSVFDLRGTLTLPGGMMEQALYGKAKRYGWLLESVLYTAQGTRIATQEILDNGSNTLLILRQWAQRGLPHHVETILLRPD